MIEDACIIKPRAPPEACVATRAYGQQTRQTGAGPLPVLAGCYADRQGSDIRMFSQHGGPVGDSC